MAIRLDDLLLGSYKIYQDSDLFCFGTDAVLLYHSIPSQRGKRYIDLCTGNGVVPLLMLAGGKAERADALEIQEQSVKLFRKSADRNGCSDKLKINCGDIRKISDFYQAGSFDTVSVNPPYFKFGAGILPAEQNIAISRHEIGCTIFDVINAISFLLKDGGEFYMVHRVNRRREILDIIQKSDLKLTKLTTVYSRPDKPSELFLIAGKKTAEPLAVRQASFTIQTEDGHLSPAYTAIYKGENA